MSLRPRFLSPILIGAAFLVTAPGQALPDPAAMTALESMIDSLGGRAAVDRVRSMAVEAVCSGPGGRFTTQVKSVRDAGVYFRQAGGDRITEIWSTSERTWSMGTDGVVTEHPAAVRSFVRGHEFHLLLLEITDRFSNYRTAGLHTIEGQPALRIDMIDDGGLPASLWLSPETHMPLLLELNPEGAAGAVRLTFRDWVEIDGLTLFRGFDLEEGDEREFRYDYVSIAVNPALPGLFATRLTDEQARQAIEAILTADREAHLNTDAAGIGENLAEEIVEVSNGARTTRSRREVVDFFTASFRGAIFHAWEDSTPPLIRISEDRSMAWVVRTVSAEREDRQDGRPVRTRYTSAYTATYEKFDDRWRMTSVTSTFLPDQSGSGH